MKKKLTLFIEESVINQAKELARHKHQSVSKLVENYLLEQMKEQSWKPEKGSKLEKLVGVIRPSTEELTDEDLLYAVLSEKY